jgi:F-type H+-transporting ATPase subunit delta
VSKLLDRSVARRYAEAFVISLESAGRVDEGLEEIRVVAATYQANRELQHFLGSPEIGNEEKQKLLKKIFGDKTGVQTMGLLELLLKRERVEYLPEVAEDASSVAELRRGVLRGYVTTARPISAAEADKVAASVGGLLKKKVLLERTVDASIIGGLRVVVGTDLLDSSVKTLLENARRHLLSVKVSE